MERFVATGDAGLSDEDLWDAVADACPDGHAAALDGLLAAAQVRAAGDRVMLAFLSAARDYHLPLALDDAKHRL